MCGRTASHGYLSSGRSVRSHREGRLINQMGADVDALAVDLDSSSALDELSAALNQTRSVVFPQDVTKTLLTCVGS